MRKCKDCPKEATKGPRCVDCNRAFRTEQSRKRRRRQKEQRLKDNKTLEKKGKKVCSKCFKLRHLTEYSPSRKNRAFTLNKVCDECLTKIYELQRFSDYPELRKKSYLVNTVGRQHLARSLGVSMVDVKTKDLDYVCHPQDLAELLVKAQQRCVYCRVELSPDNFSVDHVNPLSRGGEHSLHNLQPLCHDCNHLKHARDDAEFRVFLYTYLKRLKIYAA